MVKSNQITAKRSHSLNPVQVRRNYLQLIDNLLEAIPDNILASQHQANTSTRCLKLGTIVPLSLV